MTKAVQRAVAVGLALFVYESAQLAHAGEECVNDWPSPDECFPDILCEQYAEYWNFRRAVVHLSGPDIGGTGVLINNVKCHASDDECGTPYLLTANHVVSGYYNEQMSPGEMNDIETLTAFTFGLEAAVCGGPTAGGAVAMVGATIVAHDPTRDLLLLRLDTSLPPELGAFFVGWCGGAFPQAISISHPCGAPKRIAISDTDDIQTTTTMAGEMYDVYWWQEGALAGASSGAPLLDEQTGALKGIYLEAVQAGSLACSEPNGTPAQDRFSALSNILEFLPPMVDGGAGCIDHFDSNEYAPVAGTVEDSHYYGPGVTKEISATETVWLLDGFWASKGSNITIFTTEP